MTRKIQLRKSSSERLRESFARELNDAQRAAATAPDGYNLIQSFTGAIFAPNKQHHTDLSGDKFPNLGIDPALRDNGGLAKLHTFTLALLPGSPAIDKIPLAACHVNGIVADQRGMKRPDENENTCDIGAYESGT